LCVVVVTTTRPDVGRADRPVLVEVC